MHSALVTMLSILIDLASTLIGVLLAFGFPFLLGLYLDGVSRSTSSRFRSKRLSKYEQK